MPHMLALTTTWTHGPRQVSSSLPYRSLYEANVAGTRRCLELASLFRDGCGSVNLLHVSTLGFVPPGHPEKLAVRFCPSNHAATHGGSGGCDSSDRASTRRNEAMRIAGLSGYAQSKLMAERFVALAAGAGGADAAPAGVAEQRLVRRLLVCRPGTIFGDPLTGASNPRDGVSLMLCACVKEEAICLHPSESPLPPE